MVKVQQVLIENNLIKLLEVYQKYKLEEMFRKLVYKHTMNIPEVNYISRINYQMDMELEEHIKFVYDFIQSLKSSLDKAMMFSGIKNIFDFTGERLIEKMAYEMDSLYLLNFFEDAYKILEQEVDIDEIDKAVVQGIFTEVSKSLGMSGRLDKQNKSYMDLLSEKERLLLEVGSLFESENEE